MMHAAWQKETNNKTKTKTSNYDHYEGRTRDLGVNYELQEES